MTDLPVIPKVLQPVAPIIEQYLQPLLLWFSQYVYARLLARDKDHQLLQLQKLLDFTPLETACADYHHRTGNGRRSPTPLPFMPMLPWNR